MSIRWKGAAVALLLAAGGAVAWAQMPGPGAGPGAGGGNGPGPGMMSGYGHGYAPHMYGPWGSKDFARYGKNLINARMNALRNTLKITDAQKPAWDAYAAAAIDAKQHIQQSMWHTMSRVMQPGMMFNVTPDQRFALMEHIITLHKQGYDQMKQAAAALLAHLTPYQQGQASVLLPGLATGTGGFVPFGRGMGMGYGMMGVYGGYGMMDFGR